MMGKKVRVFLFIEDNWVGINIILKKIQFCIFDERVEKIFISC